MMFMMIFFWGLIIVAMFLGVRWVVGLRKAPSSDSSLDILRERYERGEMNNDEFEAKKKDLN
jgi:putative membrane protein